MTLDILMFLLCLHYLMRLSANFQVVFWTCFWSLSLFVYQSDTTFHVEDATRTQYWPWHPTSVTVRSTCMDECYHAFSSGKLLAASCLRCLNCKLNQRWSRSRSPLRQSGTDSKTCRVFWGFEQLSSAISWGVMALPRNTAYAWFMPDFGWNHPEAKVFISFIFMPTFPLGRVASATAL